VALGVGEAGAGEAFGGFPGRTGFNEQFEVFGIDLPARGQGGEGGEAEIAGVDGRTADPEQGGLDVGIAGDEAGHRHGVADEVGIRLAKAIGDEGFPGVGGVLGRDPGHHGEGGASGGGSEAGAMDDFAEELASFRGGGEETELLGGGTAMGGVVDLFTEPTDHG